MFSVVIPLFNKVQYIEKAIQSVLDQSFPDFELIIINDGSTDGSAELAASFDDWRLRIINQDNSGVSSARNKGVAHSKFGYVAFLDADDWWSPHFLHEMSSLISAFPKAGVYGSKYFTVKNGINTEARIGVPDHFTSGYIDYFTVYARTFWVPINCSFVVVRKSLFEEVGGFRPTLKFGEDLDLWIRMALKDKVAYINKFLAYSNQDVELVTRALGTGKYWQKEEYVLFNLDYLKAEEKKHPSLKVLLDGLRVRALSDFYLHSQHPDAVRQILDSIDFSEQPSFYKFIYRWPKWLVRTYFRCKQIGSILKQAVIRNYRMLHFTISF